MRNLLILATLLLIAGYASTQTNSKTLVRQLRDVDGNDYGIITVGDYSWTTKNLEVKHFRNGDAIPQAQSDEEWLAASENQSPAWCYYKDEKGVDKSTVLYNWYAVNDKRGLAPLGSHIPSIFEWNNLIEHMGGMENCSRIIKSKEGWISPQITIKHKLNEFNAQPAGSRYASLNASFNWYRDASKGRYANYWTSTHGEYGLDMNHANRIGLSFDIVYVIMDLLTSTEFENSILNDKGNGFSIRLIYEPDYANVFWKKGNTLFDLISDKPILPKVKNGKKVYTIYYSSNEDPEPYKGSFTEAELENHLYYKFKSKKTCKAFCKLVKGL